MDGEGRVLQPGVRDWPAGPQGALRGHSEIPGWGGVGGGSLEAAGGAGEREPGLGGGGGTLSWTAIQYPWSL